VKYLPAEFHTAKAFNEILLMLKKDLQNPSVLGERIDSPLLLLGLVYREISRAMEVEPDAPNEAPVHLIHSPFGIKEMKKIESMLKGIRLPSQK
jgi:hypothetical protein